jgi:hypothetical protein
MTIRFWKLEILKKEIKWVLHVLEFPNNAIFLFANSNGKRYIEFVGFNFQGGRI